MAETVHTEIDRVCGAIFQAIFERRLEPNTRLVETQLAKVLSSSRSNIRQALLLLEQRKLVKIVPNKGAIVAEPTEKEAAEVFTARICIELKILELVCERFKAKDLKVLHAHLKKEQQARQKQDRHGLIYYTGQFHILLAEIAGNQVLLDFLKHLVARSSLILEKYETQSDQSCPYGDHEGLVQFIADGEKEKAKHFLNQHFSEIEQRLNFTEKNQQDDLSEVFASMFN